MGNHLGKGLIMRILWHSPGLHPTGYGEQTRLFVPQLTALGHEVVIAQMAVSDETAGGTWEGCRVIGPHLASPFLLPARHEVWDAFGGHDPDLLIGCKDPNVLPFHQYKRYRSAVIAPVDCSPLSALDAEFFRRSEATPLAVTRHGERELKAAGFAPLYCPHGIDPVFRPGDKAAARAALALDPARFIVGVNAANNERPSRKMFGEVLAGFAEFRGADPAALLLMHTEPGEPGGDAVVAARGRPRPGRCGVVLAAAGDGGVAGRWYRSLDVLLSIGNEGFGLPTVEAQACGVPVIGLAAAATSELVRSGMQVGGQEWWNYAHQAWWVTPDVGQVAAQLRKARSRPRACALVGAYGAEEVFRCHWKPALDKLLA